VGRLCYVYGAIEEARASLPDRGMPGGRPPRRLSLDDRISLVVSDVPSDVYGPGALEPKLSDLEWVGQAGAAHHAVIEALADQGAVVVPFRLFTIYSTDKAAVSALRAAQPALSGVFDRVRGRQEWVLRIGRPDAARAVPARSTAEQRTAATPQPASTGRGARFLQAKAQARRERAARAQRVRADAAAAYEALARLADDATMRPVEDQGSLLLDGVFLVRPERVEMMREALTRTVARLLEDGCSVSLTGPWPPYSFSSFEVSRHG
jgi:hypothetical protein